MRAFRLVKEEPKLVADRTDDELMTLAQAGERQAFGVLVERHAERLLLMCIRFVMDADVGAELAQETWSAVWTARAQYRPEGKFVVWLLSSARNRCRNHVRHLGVRRKQAQREGGAGGEGLVGTQIDELLLEERRRRVRAALSRLPERMREALLLRFAEELHYHEMSHVLGVSESTLRSRVHHGLRLLKDLLERDR